MAIADKLNELITQRDNLAANLNTMGVSASNEEKLSSLVPKVLDIQSGGSSEITKGLIINECDSNGYVTDAEIVGLTTLPDYYFQYTFYNSSLFSKLGDNLKLSDTITKIGRYCFQYCNKLAITTLPSGLITLGAYAFGQCASLAIKETPAGVKDIQPYVFYFCSGLTEMTCKGVITSVGNYAFAGCSKLNKFVLPNITSVPTLSNTNAFNNTPIASGTGYIYVPDDLVTSFQSASNWSTYASQIKGISELPTN